MSNERKRQPNPGNTPCPESMTWGVRLLSRFSGLIFGSTTNDVRAGFSLALLGRPKGYIEEASVYTTVAGRNEGEALRGRWPIEGYPKIAGVPKALPGSLVALVARRPL